MVQVVCEGGRSSRRSRQNDSRDVETAQSQANKAATRDSRHYAGKEVCEMRSIEIWVNGGGWCKGGWGVLWRDPKAMAGKYCWRKRAAPQVRRSGDRLRIETRSPRGDREASREFMSRRRRSGRKYPVLRGVRFARPRCGRVRRSLDSTRQMRFAPGEAARSSSTLDGSNVIRNQAHVVSSL